MSERFNKLTPTDAERLPALVPQVAPYGSITDGDWMCGRCGETITGCSLCAGEIVHVVRAKGRG